MIFWSAMMKACLDICLTAGAIEERRWALAFMFAGFVIADLGTAFLGRTPS